ncbi:MAG: 7-carboxy-7-deazaguanine synthase QueE [Deltaproteobacteria bacterium]|nr:7-carboxy-7-deazaguanine synthase QueE [Deltaproteobacteria bacterium]
MSEAQLIEIFSSIQGEGLRLGEMQTFVRFQGCSLRCRWCDTPENFNPKKNYRVEDLPFSGTWSEHPNSISAEKLLQFLSHFKNTWVSFTGGEPLEQADFLEECLKIAPKHFRFLLETGGFLPGELERIISYLHCVSMDIKLPSSTQTGEYWIQHGEFLKVAQRAPQFYVKMVLTEKTVEEELQRALHLIASINEKTPVILQPVSAIKGFSEWVSIKKIAHFYQLSSQFKMPLKIIPQVHKGMGVN